MSPGSRLSFPKCASFAFTVSAMPRMKLGNPRPIETVSPSAVYRPTVKSSASYTIMLYAVRMRLVFISSVTAMTPFLMISVRTASAPARVPFTNHRPSHEIVEGAECTAFPSLRKSARQCGFVPFRQGRPADLDASMGRRERGSGALMGGSVQRLLRFAILSSAVLLGSCGGGPGASDGGGSPVAGACSVGGTIAGLLGSGLVLQNNGGGDLPASGAAFIVPARIASGAVYSVSILSQPANPSQTCVLGNGSGTMGDADVASVTVICTTNVFNVGGAVTGLVGRLVLRNNGAADLTLTANESFTFAAPVASGAG